MLKSKLKTALLLVLLIFVLLFTASCHAGYGNESDELINAPKVSSESSL